MTDYTELVNELRGVPNGKVDSRYLFYTLCNRAADAIEELKQIADHYEESAHDYFKDVCYYMERVPKWISVKEQFPEKGGNYIVCHSGEDGAEVSEADYDKRGNCWYDPIEQYIEYHVTHWMPLPEPPKEDEA